jgi:hypothetical protein
MGNEMVGLGKLLQELGKKSYSIGRKIALHILSLLP